MSSWMYPPFSTPTTNTRSLISLTRHPVSLPLSPSLILVTLLPFPFSPLLSVALTKPDSSALLQSHLFLSYLQCSLHLYLCAMPQTLPYTMPPHYPIPVDAYTITILTYLNDCRLKARITIMMSVTERSWKPFHVQNNIFPSSSISHSICPVFRVATVNVGTQKSQSCKIVEKLEQFIRLKALEGGTLTYP